jgi:hypothetical protein
MIYALAISGGCATPVDRYTLMVDTREAGRSAYLPEEFEQLLESLGYEWLPLADPDIGHPVKIATIYGEYRMLFQLRYAADIKVDVHIRQDGKFAGLHFKQDERPSLDEDATQYYMQLRERLEFEFGPDRVSGNHPLLAP